MKKRFLCLLLLGCVFFINCLIITEACSFLEDYKIEEYVLSDGTVCYTDINDYIYPPRIFSTDLLDNHTFKLSEETFNYQLLELDSNNNLNVSISDNTHYEIYKITNRNRNSIECVCIIEFEGPSVFTDLPKAEYLLVEIGTFK